jgi:serine/threonine-protein kinase
MLIRELGQPATIGRYDIRREIGRGMMGVVYEAFDTVLGRTIALKAIQLAFPVAPHEREEFERRFFAEAQIAARLSHPNIVVVHDVGRDPESGTLFIALEHLEGRPLSAIVTPGSPLPWREALRIVQRVAEALHHAHAQGVVHRDVKPANIVLLTSGEPKILDFGIARLAQEQGHLTPGKHFFGTPLYMSPEQALGRPVDGRSDLFALGAVLYFLLLGRAAFAAENIPTILVRVVRQYPPPPSFLRAEIPAVVDDIVARATAKDPAHRYPDGKSMAEDIEDILAGRARGIARRGARPPFRRRTRDGRGHGRSARVPAVRARPSATRSRAARPGP